jgi:hypothetical protein
MIRFLTLLFFGLFFWLVADFVYYAGLMVNYIKAWRIPVYFNEFFIDNQHLWLWGIGILVCGGVFVLPLPKWLKSGLAALLMAAASVTWVPSWGEAVGRRLFAQPHALYRFDGVGMVQVTRLYAARKSDYVLLPGKTYAVPYPPQRRVTPPAL